MYLNNESFPGAPANTANFAGHMAVETGSGWQTEELTPAVPSGEYVEPYNVSYIFSSDLTGEILRVPVRLTEKATQHIYDLYRTDIEPGAYSPAYALINSAEPANSAEELCGLAGLATCFQTADVSAYAGASLDLSHVLFESTAKLTAQAPESPTESLYESFEGKVVSVGILPDGQDAASSTAGGGSAATYESSAQFVDDRVERAISEDGSHVVFQAPADGGLPDASQDGLTEVYDRIDGGETIELSAPEGTPTNSTPEPAQFWDASTDGKRVFFTSSAELTSTSNTGTSNASEDLYEYNFEKKEPLTDLTKDTSASDATTGAGVLGVVGASGDGAYVYFVADGELAPGEGVDGQPNLYMVHNGGAPVFIATLDPTDTRDWTPYAPQLEAYVTPEGTHLAFTSVARLTGYDNLDQKTSEPDDEVYEYAAPTPTEEGSGGKGVLRCVSCDPGGGAPFGNELLGGTTPYGGIGTPFHRVRSVSENGSRVFFSGPPLASEIAYDSSETTIPKVYEYEQSGEGSCSASAGCLYRLSSDQNTEEDSFLEASADGGQAFFVTASQLVASDKDKLPDIYDASVDGGFATPSSEEPCQSACRPVGATPSVTGSPLSSIAGPSGNLVSPPPPVASRPAGTAPKAKTKKTLSCRARAKRIKGSKARKRALARCNASTVRHSKSTHKSGGKGR